MTQACASPIMATPTREPAGQAMTVEQLFDRYAPVFWRFFAVRTGSDQHAADDLMQQLWLQARLKGSSVRFGKAEAWLWQVAQGLGPDGRYHVKVVELYYAGQLPQYIQANALELGGVPLELGFSQDGSSVKYSFREPERKYLCSLVELARHIADAQNADDLTGRLQSAAGHVRVEAAEQGWRLRAAAFQPSVLFPELDLSVPDLDLPRVLDQVAFEIEFVEPGCRYYTFSGGEPLKKLHISVDQSALTALADETKSADEFAARVRPLTRAVTVSPGSHGGTAVRIVGYDWKLDTSERDRLRQIATEIVPGIELLIEYDPETNAVRWAEFRNLSPTGGSIRLEPGAVELDPASLDPKHWITEETMVYE